MTFKQKILLVHRWLGFVSGPLVFIIALTGAIYAFQMEIEDAVHDYRFISKSEKEQFLPPTEIQKSADAALPGKHLHAVLYYKEERAAKAIYFSFEDEYYYTVYVNPYSGEVQKVKDEYTSFFGFILDGHFNLWLPREIGQPIVASATLVFFFIVVSGLFLWWPKKKKKKKTKFTIRWSGKWRRRNYDLHTVIGMYASLIALIFIVTGLVMGFNWFRNSFYYTISGGESYVDYYAPNSSKVYDSTGSKKDPLDAAWLKMNEMYPDAYWIEVHPPEVNNSSLAANANPTHGTYYDMRYHYFDLNTLEELPVKHSWDSGEDRSLADKIMRMNYDIHIGSILGFPGKLLACLVSLLIASLPVTGFLMWYGRKYKKKKS